MKGLTKFAAVAGLSAATLLYPQASRAMTVEMYDAMAVEDQADYLKLLVKRAQDVLVGEGQQDLAAQLDELFRTRRGEPQSTGAAQFDRQMAITRNYVAQQEHVKGLRVKPYPGDVEAALVTSLQKNGIPMTHARFKALSQAWLAKPFRPKHPLRTTN